MTTKMNAQPSTGAKPNPLSELSASPLMMQITDKEFDLLRGLIYERFGINLTEQKKSLVVGRLQKLLRISGFQNFKEYYDYLIKNKSTENLIELVNRISTNYSFFYREKAHFDFFVKTALPAIKSDLNPKRSRDMRIWTAGCSTGEEPYMLAMLMLEHFGMDYKNWDLGVLATDISERALGIAKMGIYPEDRTREVPSSLKHRYFRKVSAEEMAIQEKIKKEVTFRRFNLINQQFPFKKPFHMIFCRNVMIYFDKQTRDNLVRKFHDFLTPGGFLFIGHSETLGREQSLFRYIQPATYMRL